MPRLDTMSRLLRVIRFLIGSGDPRVFSLLGLRGFTNAERRTGWELFYRAGGSMVDLIMPKSGVNPATFVHAVDVFENEWFDVIDAALEHPFPEIHQLILQNLHKTTGPQVVLTVKTILDRIDTLDQQGDAGKAALALLATRGFTPEVRAKGRDLLEQLSNADVQVLPSRDPAAEAERIKAEDEMWHWYRDWAKTARTVVRRKDLRIKLGISSRSQADEPEIEPGPEPLPVPPDGAGARSASPASAPA